MLLGTLTFVLFWILLIKQRESCPDFSIVPPHAGHTRKASQISKTAVDNCGKGVGNFYLS